MFVCKNLINMVKVKNKMNVYEWLLAELDDPLIFFFKIICEQTFTIA